MPTTAMMLAGGGAGGGSVAPADIATLVTALGGDTVVRGFYDARAFVRTTGTSVILVEDARNTSFGGRYYFPGASTDGIDCGRCTSFDGATKATWIIWGIRHAQIGTYCSVSNNASTSPFIIYHPSNILRVLFGASSGIAEFTMSQAVVPLGSICKLMVVYDGTQAVGSRVTAYFAVYDRATGTWGSRTSLTKTSDTAPANMATTASETIRLGAWGSGGTYTNPFIGCLDEVRMWVGTAMTTAQLDAETLTTNAVAADFRYTFATDASNSGSVVGNNGTIAGNVRLCSGDLTYGSPLGAVAASFPTYDGSASFATSSSAANGLSAGTPGFTQDGGNALVATEPTAAGSPTVCCMFGGAAASSDEYLTTFKNSGSMKIWSAANGPTVVAAAGTRVIHSRHTGTGASKTCGIQDGTGAEATTTSSSFSTTLPQIAKVAQGVSTNGADITFHALIILDGAITSTQRSDINTWAAAHHGATV